MTGKRLLKQLLSWDFDDYTGRWAKTKSTARKKWSKKLRNALKKDDLNTLNNIN